MQKSGTENLFLMKWEVCIHVGVKSVGSLCAFHGKCGSGESWKCTMQEMQRQPPPGEADLQLHIQAVLALLSFHSWCCRGGGWQWQVSRSAVSGRALHHSWSLGAGHKFPCWSWPHWGHFLDGQPHLAILLAEAPLLMVSALVLQCFVPPSIDRTRLYVTYSNLYNREWSLLFFFFFFKLGRGALKHWIMAINFCRRNSKVWSAFFLPSWIRGVHIIQNVDSNCQFTVGSLTCNGKVATSSVFLCLTPETVTWVGFHLPITDFSNCAVR